MDSSADESSASARACSSGVLADLLENVDAIDDSSLYCTCPIMNSTSHDKDGGDTQTQSKDAIQQLTDLASVTLSCAQALVRRLTLTPRLSASLAAADCANDGSGELVLPLSWMSPLLPLPLAPPRPAAARADPVAVWDEVCSQVATSLQEISLTNPLSTRAGVNAAMTDINSRPLKQESGTTGDCRSDCESILVTKQESHSFVDAVDATHLHANSPLDARNEQFEESLHLSARLNAGCFCACENLLTPTITSDYEVKPPNDEVKPAPGYAVRECVCCQPTPACSPQSLFPLPPHATAALSALYTATTALPSYNAMLTAALAAAGVGDAGALVAFPHSSTPAASDAEKKMLDTNANARIASHPSVGARTRTLGESDCRSALVKSLCLCQHVSLGTLLSHIDIAECDKWHSHHKSLLLPKQQHGSASVRASVNATVVDETEKSQSDVSYWLSQDNSLLQPLTHRSVAPVAPAAGAPTVTLAPALFAASAASSAPGTTVAEVIVALVSYLAAVSVGDFTVMMNTVLYSYSSAAALVCANKSTGSSSDAAAPIVTLAAALALLPTVTSLPLPVPALTITGLSPSPSQQQPTAASKARNSSGDSGVWASASEQHEGKYDSDSKSTNNNFTKASAHACDIVSSDSEQDDAAYFSALRSVLSTPPFATTASASSPTSSSPSDKGSRVTDCGFGFTLPSEAVTAYDDEISSRSSRASSSLPPSPIATAALLYTEVLLWLSQLPLETTFLTAPLESSLRAQVLTKLTAALRLSANPEPAATTLKANGQEIITTEPSSAKLDLSTVPWQQLLHNPDALGDARLSFLTPTPLSQLVTNPNATLSSDFTNDKTQQHQQQKRPNLLQVTSSKCPPALSKCLPAPSKYCVAWSPSLLLHPTVGVSLTCVGDDDQSIYAFRGGDGTVFLSLFTRFPPHATLTVILPQTYRCSGAILAAARAVIDASEAPRCAKPLWTRNPRGARVAVAVSRGPEREAQRVVRRIVALYEQSQAQWDDYELAVKRWGKEQRRRYARTLDLKQTAAPASSHARIKDAAASGSDDEDETDGLSVSTSGGRNEWRWWESGSKANSITKTYTAIAYDTGAHNSSSISSSGLTGHLLRTPLPLGHSPHKPPHFSSDSRSRGSNLVLSPTRLTTETETATEPGTETELPVPVPPAVPRLRWCDFAVLARTNAPLKQIFKELKHRSISAARVTRPSTAAKHKRKANDDDDDGNDSEDELFASADGEGEAELDSAVIASDPFSTEPCRALLAFLALTADGGASDTAAAETALQRGGSGVTRPAVAAVREVAKSELDCKLQIWQKKGLDEGWLSRSNAYHTGATAADASGGLSSSVSGMRTPMRVAPSTPAGRSQAAYAGSQAASGWARSGTSVSTPAVSGAAPPSVAALQQHNPWASSQSQSQLQSQQAPVVPRNQQNPWLPQQMPQTPLQQQQDQFSASVAVTPMSKRPRLRANAHIFTPDLAPNTPASRNTGMYDTPRVSSTSAPAGSRDAIANAPPVPSLARPEKPLLSLLSACAMISKNPQHYRRATRNSNSRSQSQAPVYPSPQLQSQPQSQTQAGKYTGAALTEASLEGIRALVTTVHVLRQECLALDKAALSTATAAATAAAEAAEAAKQAAAEADAAEAAAAAEAATAGSASERHSQNSGSFASSSGRSRTPMRMADAFRQHFTPTRITGQNMGYNSGGASQQHRSQQSRQVTPQSQRGDQSNSSSRAASNERFSSSSSARFSSSCFGSQTPHASASSGTDGSASSQGYGTPSRPQHHGHSLSRQSDHSPLMAAALAARARASAAAARARMLAAEATQCYNTSTRDNDALHSALTHVSASADNARASEGADGSPVLPSVRELPLRVTVGGSHLPPTLRLLSVNPTVPASVAAAATLPHSLAAAATAAAAAAAAVSATSEVNTASGTRTGGDGFPYPYPSVVVMLASAFRKLRLDRVLAESALAAARRKHNLRTSRRNGSSTARSTAGARMGAASAAGTHGGGLHRTVVISGASRFTLGSSTANPRLSTPLGGSGPAAEDMSEEALCLPTLHPGESVAARWRRLKSSTGPVYYHPKYSFTHDYRSSAQNSVSNAIANGGTKHAASAQASAAQSESMSLLQRWCSPLDPQADLPRQLLPLYTSQMRRVELLFRFAAAFDELVVARERQATANSDNNNNNCSGSSSCSAPSASLYPKARSVLREFTEAVRDSESRGLYFADVLAALTHPETAPATLIGYGSGAHSSGATGTLMGATTPGLFPSGGGAAASGGAAGHGHGHGQGDSGGVVLSTVHRAKGLEWPVVIVLRFNEGHMPMGSSFYHQQASSNTNNNTSAASNGQNGSKALVVAGNEGLVTRMRLSQAVLSWLGALTLHVPRNYALKLPSLPFLLTNSGISSNNTNPFTVVRNMNKSQQSPTTDTAYTYPLMPAWIAALSGLPTRAAASDPSNSLRTANSAAPRAVSPPATSAVPAAARASASEAVGNPEVKPPAQLSLHPAVLRRAEERRLAYVALTRARHRLLLSVLREDEDGRQMAVSEFLGDIPERLLEFSAKERRTTGSNSNNVKARAKQGAANANDDDDNDGDGGDDPDSASGSDDSDDDDDDDDDDCGGDGNDDQNGANNGSDTDDSYDDDDYSSVNAAHAHGHGHGPGHSAEKAPRGFVSGGLSAQAGAAMFANTVIYQKKRHLNNTATTTSAATSNTSVNASVGGSAVCVSAVGVSAVGVSASASGAVSGGPKGKWAGAGATVPVPVLTSSVYNKSDNNISVRSSNAGTQPSRSASAAARATSSRAKRRVIDDDEDDEDDYAD